MFHSCQELVLGCFPITAVFNVVRTLLISVNIILGISHMETFFLFFFVCLKILMVKLIIGSW